MSKSMIVNKLGNKKLVMYVPANSTSAQSFADAILDGESKVYEETSSIGSDDVSSARDVNVMLKNDASGQKTYLSFIIKNTKHEGDVISALQGKTFDGILADTVVIISMRTREF